MWPVDIVFKIGEYMTDRGKIRLSSTSRATDRLKYVFDYNEIVDVAKIYQLPYFDNFKHVRISNKKNMCPKNVISIHFWAHTTKIPYGVTHLSFFDYFYESLKKCIPTTVKYLQFIEYFNQSVDDCIPNSVVKLVFGNNFRRKINSRLPSSITHLTFGRKFNQSLDKNILQSVTHLTFGNNFNHKINNCIPKSVTHLVFGKNFDKSLIPVSYTHLTLPTNREV